ncbi:hypothetical protein IB227_16170 [Stenotrophomonas sp. STM01]|uniref:hypothetical protein n=1 Tax=Stenotrophomonas sp. STM01 TaxID=2769278 RepID=UPI00177F1B9D|nr:hypothetical protein [Stenotrophomonas sp. STM01]MBD9537386.1 hypothetical protein [Stenotrophomonas sp. STM01]
MRSNDFGHAVDLDAGSPEQIYSYVTQGVRDVICALETQNADADDESVQSEIIAALNLMQARVAAKQEELRTSADWKDFTVALYGETNAGKSTIIESLRIHLGEAEKREQRRRYDALKASHGLDEASIEATRRSITIARESAATAVQRSTELETQAQSQLHALELEVNEQKQAVALAVAGRTWWQRMLGMFKPDPQAAATVALQARLDDLRTRHTQERQQLENEKAAADAVLASAEDELGRRLRSLPLLVEHADGAIIGDGRPDFTRETQRYVFDNGGAPIVLLDVPGIEGGEAGVKAHIDRAVQTAHAVFYVTGKAARPQHGDKEDGTLEKIKRHLGPQTEVWAVFNKRVTATMPLRNAANLFANDADGMLDLDKGLSDALASNYKGVLPVSAYPAFLALADRLPPSEALPDAALDRSGARAKFLAEFDAPQLLEKTGFAAMADHLTSMAVDAPRKIRQANVFKANQSLRSVVEELDRHATSLESHARKVITETKAAQGHVDMAASRLRCSLRSDASNALRTFETGARNEVYGLINDGISNESLKSKLEDSMNRHAVLLSEDLAKASQKSMTAFQESIAKTTERLQKHLKDLGEIASGKMRQSSVTGFSLDLKIDNGISVIGLVTSGISTALLAFAGPPGWVLVTISAIGIAISFAKALWSLIDEDFKKAQQRKAVDENLLKARSSLTEDLENSERDIMAALDVACVDAKNRLSIPQRAIKAKASILRLSTTRLDALTSRIETTLA